MESDVIESRVDASLHGADAPTTRFVVAAAPQTDLHAGAWCGLYAVTIIAGWQRVGTLPGPSRPRRTAG